MTKKTKKRLNKEKEYLSLNPHTPALVAFPNLAILDKFLLSSEQELNDNLHEAKHYGTYSYAQAVNTWSKIACSKAMLIEFLSMPIDNEENILNGKNLTRWGQLFNQPKHLKIFYEEVLSPDNPKLNVKKISEALAQVPLEVAQNQASITFEKSLFAYDLWSHTFMQNLCAYVILNPLYKEEAVQPQKAKMLWITALNPVSLEVEIEIKNIFNLTALTFLNKKEWKNLNSNTIESKIEGFTQKYTSLLSSPVIKSWYSNEPNAVYFISSWLWNAQHLDAQIKKELCASLSRHKTYDFDYNLKYLTPALLTPQPPENYKDIIFAQSVLYPHLSQALEHMKTNHILNEKISIESALDAQDMVENTPHKKNFKI